MKDSDLDNELQAFARGGALEYNTQRPALILSEYGRNVQKLTRYLLKIEDREARTRAAHTLISLLKQLNPAVRESSDNIQRIWDHLYLMTDLKLDIDGPYPPPEADVLNKKPLPVGYADGPLRFRHYGRNIEILINHALRIEDREEQLGALGYIGKLMKGFYSTWNRENGATDDMIINDMKAMAKGRLVLDIETVQALKLFETAEYNDDTHDYSNFNHNNTSGNNHSNSNRRTSTTASTSKKRRKRKDPKRPSRR
ncbi:MAG: DUF4290 domain-containing protein [Bernardetiaceae bacterium]|nr:DUF4290 domain-containing protein [Bernardetiaceae bacterium]